MIDMIDSLFVIGCRMSHINIMIARVSMLILVVIVVDNTVDLGVMMVRIGQKVLQIRGQTEQDLPVVCAMVRIDKIGQGRLGCIFFVMPLLMVIFRF